MVPLAAQASRREMETMPIRGGAQVLAELAMNAAGAGTRRGPARKLLDTGFSGGFCMAPQTGFESMTFWLTVIVLDFCELPSDELGRKARGRTPSAKLNPSGG